MVALTREAGCSLHLAHATMNFGVNKGRAPELLSLLDEALAAGADITLDTYPYTPGCTTLAAMLPSWASEGGPEAILQAAGGRGDGRAHPPRPGGHRLGRLPRRAHRVGHDRDLGRERSGPGRVRRPDGPGVGGRCGARRPGRPRAGCCWPTGWPRRSSSTSATRRTSGRSCATACTPAARTASSRAPSRTRAPTARSRTTSGTTCGSWGCCPWRSASRTSPRARRPGCGCRTGAWSARDTGADLVLFDPATVAAGSTFAEPRTLPTGIPHVLVDGRFVIEDGRRTDVLAGRAVRRTAPA